MKYHCAYHYITLRRLFLLVPTFFISLIFFVLYLFLGIYAIVIPAIFVPVLIITAIKLIPMAARERVYSVSDSSLRVSSGVFIKKTRIISLKNIQYTTLRQSFVHKIFGLCTLNIMLGAGTVPLFGMSFNDAERLRLALEE